MKLLPAVHQQTLSVRVPAIFSLPLQQRQNGIFIIQHYGAQGLRNLKRAGVTVPMLTTGVEAVRLTLEYKTNRWLAKPHPTDPRRTSREKLLSMHCITTFPW